MADSLRDAVKTLVTTLDYRLFPVGGKDVSVGAVVAAALLLVGTQYVVRGSDRAVAAALRRQGVEHESRVRPTQRIARYLLWFAGMSLSLNALGVDVSTLFTAGAIFAVGVGFAMQSIAQNFVSGLILLVERNIRPGDVIYVEGTFVRIQEMGIRSTVARTRDDEELIIPNFTLAQSSVRNYTLSDTAYRLRAVVGVTYDSDMSKVRDVLGQVGSAFPGRLPDRRPVVLMTAFGDNSVNWELSVWVTDPWEGRPLLSDLNQAVWWAFKEAGLVIAFPQLDVHLDDRALHVLDSRRGNPERP